MGSGPFPHFPSREITSVVENDFKPYEWIMVIKLKHCLENMVFEIDLVLLMNLIVVIIISESCLEWKQFF